MTPERIMIEQLKKAGAEHAVPDEDPAARAERQRAEDAEIVERLRRASFRGHEMDLTRERLWGYAMVCLNGWCSDGHIVLHVQESATFLAEFRIEGRHADVLRSNAEERIGLVLAAIAGAWPVFAEKALHGGGWNPRWEPEAGPRRRPTAARRREPADLLHPLRPAVLPRHYWEWSADRDRRLIELGLFEDWNVRLTPWWTGSPFEDEELLVNDCLNRLMADQPDHIRHMFRMIYDGHNYAEIGDTLGISASLVASQVCKARDRWRRDRRGYREQYRAITGHLPPPDPEDRMGEAIRQRAVQARKAGPRR
ncbi:hypothetical protein OG607_00515 [Streptomyces sp. NBC_01537]|uniref:hypothetical protein n=1 Tax=Streptomyces sp. NBC_01537 TaxID=2903896 RepID=UPI003869BEDD